MRTRRAGELVLDVLLALILSVRRGPAKESIFVPGDGPGIEKGGYFSSSRSLNVLKTDSPLLKCRELLIVVD